MALTLTDTVKNRPFELFAQNVMRAGEYFLANPMDTPFIPSWNRVNSAVPGILDQLKVAVEEDYREHCKQLNLRINTA